MPILQKLATTKRMIATEGAAATLRFTGVWLGRHVRDAILGPPPPVWRKFHLMNELARIHGYRSVLEISTAASGFTFDQLDRSLFDVCHRLSYLTPDDWTDGAPIHYRSRDRNTSECLRQLQARGSRFDIIFIDACHEYGSTRRDIGDALSLVSENGVIVLHDCLPSDQIYCAPTRGDAFDWCGVTYKAYLDVLLERDDLWYCTVDTDVGCGMIRSSRKTRLFRRAIDADKASLRAWRNAGDDLNAVYRAYERHKDALMNVVTVNQFLTAEWRNRPKPG
jgi:hypothetical protein